MLDGSVRSWLTSAADITIRLFSGEEFHIKVFLTVLDAPYPLVLGLNWLRRYNPLIDWQKGSILSFGSVDKSPLSSLGEGPAPPVETPTLSASASVPSPSPVSSLDSDSDSVSSPVSSPISISLVGAAAFQRAARLPGSTQFQIALNSLDPAVQARSASTSSDSGPDLSSVPEEYHEFADVFSKERAYRLPEHRPYDLTIDLEPGATIPPSRIYSISHSEMQALKEFIDENLRAGFIRSSSSPHGAPILFARKKDGSLRLCVDFRGLNRITRKDRYPLPLISDLLDAPGGARV